MKQLPPDEDRGPSVNAVMILATIGVFFRLYIRLFVRKKLGWDDVSLQSLIFSLTHSAFIADPSTLNILTRGSQSPEDLICANKILLCLGMDNFLLGP